MLTGGALSICGSNANAPCTSIRGVLTDELDMVKFFAAPFLRTSLSLQVKSAMSSGTLGMIAVSIIGLERKQAEGGHAAFSSGEEKP